MTQDSERIAKRLARAGVASRREAERIIAEGRVAVNGRTIDSPALNVLPGDVITLDGKPIAEPEPVRMWRYHKPSGLVTTTADEKGRKTIFDALPEDMPRVMSVGRLDLNSEGLLLLTNDGELKRRLELPSTGWLRKYRVRAKGEPTEAMLAPLRKGMSVDGERFAPMQVEIDRQQGANAWLTIGLREGKNREIRRALEAVGLEVNRLIRVSYGPFQLGELPRGEVEEIRPKVLRDQLGIKREPEKAAPEPKSGPAPRARTVARPGGKPQPGKPQAGRPQPGKPGPEAARPAKPAVSGGTRGTASKGPGSRAPSPKGPAPRGLGPKGPRPGRTRS